MRSNTILISVVMCVYNTQLEYLITAVKSILTQSYTNIELIIVDDGSSKNLYNDCIFRDSRIVVLRNEKNMGPSFSRNRGILASNGEYVAFMDSDDISSVDRLDTQLNFLINNLDYVACSSWYKEFQNRNRKICISIDDFDYYRCCLFFKNDPPLNCSALMVRSNIIKEILFDEKIRFGEDWKLWVQLSEKGKIYNIKKIMSFYRIHSGGLTSKHKEGVRINQFSDAISARKYVENKLGLNLSLEEDEILFLSKESKKIPATCLKTALDKLLSANQRANYYNQNSLLLKCKEIWRAEIMMTNNIFKLLCVVFSVRYGFVFFIKFEQFFNKLKGRLLG